MVNIVITAALIIYTAWAVSRIIKRRKGKCRGCDGCSGCNGCGR